MSAPDEKREDITVEIGRDSKVTQTKPKKIDKKEPAGTYRVPPALHAMFLQAQREAVQGARPSTSTPITTAATISSSGRTASRSTAASSSGAVIAGRTAPGLPATKSEEQGSG